MASKLSGVSAVRRPEALFLDIDGTILKSDHSMSPRVADAIKALRTAGTLVCLATGRSWEALKPLYDRMELKGPTICYNGAMIVEGPDGKIIFEQDLDDEVGRAAISEAKARNMEMVGYRHSKLLYEKSGPEVEAYVGRVKIPSGSVVFQDLEKLEFTKTIIFSEHDLLKPLKEDFEKRFPSDKLSATYSDPRFLEFMGGNIDKGRGLQEVCRIHGIEPENTVAMGDGWNDLALLQASGNPWVMGGASDEMKALFPRGSIALSVEEDGAAIIMEAMLE